MSSPIWQKNKTAVIDDMIMDYMAGEDIILDRQLIQYDIQASAAHVENLVSIDLMSSSEGQAILDKLNTLSVLIESGEFVLDSRFEDGHSAIEAYLVEQLGETGKKVHTGRSRNDQVLVACRLFLKDALSAAVTEAKAAVDACLTKAEATVSIPMPGYTHLQRAVPSSCGMWFAAFAEAMIDNLQQLIDTQKLIDSNPLGTAAGYGVNLPLNRELTTKKLNFGRLQVNPIYTQNSRGKFELSVLFALSQMLLDIRRYAWDLSLFTTQE
ncbi:MAG: lyase family protein, partial [Gammaproteobacteria bacterium]